MNRLDDIIALLNEFVGFATVSSAPNLAMIARLAELLEDAGARVEVFHDETGLKANLFATLGPETDGGIVLSGHTDVVPVTDQIWTNDPFDMIRRDGKLYGRGTCDMKGFIAAVTVLAPVFAAQVRNRPLHFAFTYDEEIGCLGAQALADSIRAKGIRPAMAIIGEPTSMRIIEGHKGCCEYTTRFEGLAGHSSAPDRGVNAVEFAVRYVARLLDLRDELQARAPQTSRFDPPWTTINTGSLHGGIAHNVIADHAAVEWEMRPVQAADAAFVREEMRAHVYNTLLPAMQAVWPDARIHTEVMGEVDGLEPTADNEARRIVAQLTGTGEADLVAFGTEAGIFQSIGMDVVVCGPGSIEQAHKPDEFLAIDQLSKCVLMLERLAGRLAA